MRYKFLSHWQQIERSLLKDGYTEENEESRQEHWYFAFDYFIKKLDLLIVYDKSHSFSYLRL